MLREAKLQEFYDAGRAMVSANMGGLSDTFHRAAEPGLSSDYVIGRAQSLKALGEENTIILGWDSLAGLIQRNSTSRTAHDKEGGSQQKKKKAATSDLVWLDLVGQLQAQVDAADRRIQGHRDYFENKYGEDWVEKLALDILDEDSFPERREGESITDYRRRIEDEIFEEMVGPDGQIKPDYHDHPDYERFKEWARDREIKAGAGAKLDNIEREKQAQVEAKGAPLSREEESVIVQREMGTATPEEAAEVMGLKIGERDGATYKGSLDRYDELKDDGLEMSTKVASTDNDAFLP